MSNIIEKADVLLQDIFLETKGIDNIDKLKGLNLVEAGILDSLMWVTILLSFEERMGIELDITRITDAATLEELKGVIVENLEKTSS